MDEIKVLQQIVEQLKNMNLLLAFIVMYLGARMLGIGRR